MKCRSHKDNWGPGAGRGAEVLMAMPEQQQEAQTAQAEAPEQGNQMSQALHKHEGRMATQACSSRNGRSISEGMSRDWALQLLVPRFGKISAECHKSHSWLLQPETPDVGQSQG